ncbi:MAG: hypothetical protein ACM31C_14290, partial [Acidobacteriota bacterium]
MVAREAHASVTDASHASSRRGSVSSPALAQRAVRADRLVAERVADDHADPRLGLGRVAPAEQR